MTALKPLADYLIEEHTGFLAPSMEIPLPQEYQAWEDLASAIPHLLLGGKLRPFLEKVLPVSSAFVKTSSPLLPAAGAVH